ncbi:MAG: putative CoA-binding protein [Anaerolineaceae bacterium]|nr:MAG: putative CoA-binding protein [Anaerolineaceae bacterium]
MTSKSVVDDFVSQKTLAVVGVSRGGQKFGNMAYRELKAGGRRLYPIHPTAEKLEGDRAYPDFKPLPEKVGGALIVVPPAQTEKVVRAAAEAGIPRVWMQQGSESAAAVKFCQENGIAEVHGECILMYAGQAGFHKFHRWVWKLFGKAPK